MSEVDRDQNQQIPTRYFLGLLVHTTSYLLLDIGILGACINNLVTGDTLGTEAIN